MNDQTQTFASFVESERTRIGKERERLLTEKAKIDQQLATLDQELAAISAYENVKAGRVTTKGTSSSGGGIRRTGQRDSVLAIIKSAGSITASDVLKKMNAGSDAEKTSIRNALAALKRNGSVDLKDGSYVVKS